MATFHVPPPPSSGHLLVNGRRPLSGHVPISGSKNASLALLAATLCSDSGASLLRNVPDLRDTSSMLTVLRSLGARVEASPDDRGGLEVTVKAGDLTSGEPCSDAVRAMRGGFFVVGPLVARRGLADVVAPGGCRIGVRPVDIYVKGLRALGADVELRHDKIRIRAANGRGLVGGCFRLDFPSVGATETLIMAAVLADGKTTLSNVAQEPEVVDLAEFLIACGARIEGAGTETITVSGRKSLQGADFTVIPDRIEAGTFMVAAAITRSRISMFPVVPEHIASVTSLLSSAGCEILQRDHQTLEISATPEATRGCLRGFNFKTSPYPGFPTDLQPQFMALLTTCTGSSIVEESIFENRMHHVKELQRLGARIQVLRSKALIHGRDQGSALVGSRVAAMDLRGGASLVLAGLAAEGVTEVAGIEHIDRGYHNFDVKLRGIGADVIRRHPSATMF